MERNMENEMETLGPFEGYIGVYRDIRPQSWNATIARPLSHPLEISAAGAGAAKPRAAFLGLRFRV